MIRDASSLGSPCAEERRRGADPAEVAAAEDDPGDRDPAPPERASLHLGGPRSRKGWPHDDA